VLALKHILEALSGLGIPSKTDSDKGGNMKTRSLLSHAILLCSLVLSFNTSITASALPWQDKTSTIKVPDAEAKAAKTVETAKDANAKFAAAEGFLKKYPASKARPQVAGYIVNLVYGATDPNQRLALAQKYLALFTEPTEANMGRPALIDAYIQLKRYDEAFDSGASYLTSNPEDVQVLVLLAVTGAEQVRNQNGKYVKASRQYGAKAIELIEADKKPALMDSESWVKQKARLPELYQQMGVISLVEQNTADAEANLEKAAKLNPADPFNYAMLGSITNNNYQTVALTVRSMPDSKSKDEMIQKANTLLDKVIEQYAHAVALSSGKPEYQALHDQVLLDLTSYYKYRHKNSDEGMQKYIDGFKLP
jgi:tetratricopeptide (TPR) repeat protein